MRFHQKRGTRVLYSEGWELLALTPTYSFRSPARLQLQSCRSPAIPDLNHEMRPKAERPVGAGVVLGWVGTLASPVWRGRANVHQPTHRAESTPSACHSERREGSHSSG